MVNHGNYGSNILYYFLVKFELFVLHLKVETLVLGMEWEPSFLEKKRHFCAVSREKHLLIKLQSDGSSTQRHLIRWKCIVDSGGKM